MVNRIGVNTWPCYLAQNAHVLPYVGSHKHRHKWMEQHSLAQQCRLNRVRGGLLIQPAYLHVTDHRKGHGAHR